MTAHIYIVAQKLRAQYVRAITPLSGTIESLPEVGLRSAAEVNAKRPRVFSPGTCAHHPVLNAKNVFVHGIELKAMSSIAQRLNSETCGGCC